MHFTREQREDWYASTKNSPFNVWLANHVKRSDGTLDLERLHDVARSYGLDVSRYAHLNPGQQRMNIGNRLRSIVPPSTYTNSKQGAEVHTQSKSPKPQISVGESVLPKPGTSSSAPVQGCSDRPVRALLQAHAAILDELRTREIVRTGNAPLGDFAEHLFARAFSWRLAPNSASGHDATDAAGLRFQIKCRRLRNGAPGERQLSVIRALPERKFDYLAAVLFAPDFHVSKAALIPHAVVTSRASHIPHVNGWRFILDDVVWSLPGVRDVTASLAAVADQI